MIRLLIFFIIVTLISLGAAWFADRPGNLLIEWQGYEIETSVFVAIIGIGLILTFALAFWSLVRNLISSPAVISDYFKRRNRDKGMEAISAGMIAIGAGDQILAKRYTSQARRALPNEPLTDMLRAQTARISGDHATSRRIYEAMLSSPETELLGLRGLFLEAKKENELEPARQYAERALRLNPALEWASAAHFDLQCRLGNWDEAIKTLETARKNGHVDKKLASRRRAVLLTAQAMECEDADVNKALSLSMEAHKLATGLVPAADIAGRILASQGSTAKAAKIIRETWKLSPHPDLATTYAYARPGDSPADRLERVRQLADLTPNNIEAPIAVADAAIEAHDWPTARTALEPLLEKRLTARICVQMARIEGGQYGDKGRVREWLARAVHAPRDPSWTADGYISEHWLPVSPITGEIDAFDWQVPVDSLEQKDSNRLLEQLNVLAADALIEAKPRDEVLPAPDVDQQDIGADTETEIITAPSTDIDAAATVTIDGSPVGAADIEPLEHDPETAEDDAEHTSGKAAPPEHAEPEPVITGSDEPIILDGRLDKEPTERTEPKAEKEEFSEDVTTAPAKKSSVGKAGTSETSEPGDIKHTKKRDAPPQKLRSLPPPSPEIAPTSEPRIFVSPRAPDDPGPDPAD